VQQINIVHPKKFALTSACNAGCLSITTQPEAAGSHTTDGHHTEEAFFATEPHFCQTSFLPDMLYDSADLLHHACSNQAHLPKQRQHPTQRGPATVAVAKFAWCPAFLCNMDTRQRTVSHTKIYMHTGRLQTQTHQASGHMAPQLHGQL
jgi:hypothetical protein